MAKIIKNEKVNKEFLNSLISDTKPAFKDIFNQLSAESKIFFEYTILPAMLDEALKGSSKEEIENVGYSVSNDEIKNKHHSQEYLTAVYNNHITTEQETIIDIASSSVIKEARKRQQAEAEAKRQKAEKSSEKKLKEEQEQFKKTLDGSTSPKPDKKEKAQKGIAKADILLVENRVKPDDGQEMPQNLAMLNDSDTLLSFDLNGEEKFKLFQDGKQVFVEFEENLFDGLNVGKDGGKVTLEVKPNKDKPPISLSSTNNSLTLNVKSEDGTVKEYTLTVGPLGAKLSCDGKDYEYKAQIDGKQAVLNPTVSTKLVEKLFSAQDNFVETKKLNTGRDGVKDAYLNQLLLLYAGSKNDKEIGFQKFTFGNNANLGVLNLERGIDEHGEMQIDSYYFTRDGKNIYLNIGNKGESPDGNWIKVNKMLKMFSTDENKSHKTGVYLMFEKGSGQTHSYFNVPLTTSTNNTQSKLDDKVLEALKAFEEEFLPESVVAKRPNQPSLDDPDNDKFMELGNDNYSFAATWIDDRKSDQFNTQTIQPITFNIASEPQAQQEQQEEAQSDKAEESDNGGNGGNNNQTQDEQPQEEEKDKKAIVDNFTQTARETEEIDRTKRKFQETPADIMIILGLALLLIAPLLGLGAVAAVVVSAVAVASTIGGMAYAASIDKLKNPLIKTYTRYLDPLSELERDIENQQEQFWQLEKQLDNAVESHNKIEAEMAENVQNDPFYSEFIGQAIADGLIPEVSTMDQFMDEEHMELRMEMLADMRKMNNFGVTAEQQNAFVDKYFRASTFEDIKVQKVENGEKVFDKDGNPVMIDGKKLVSKDILITGEKRDNLLKNIKTILPTSSDLLDNILQMGVSSEIDNITLLSDIKKIDDHSDKKNIDAIINKHFSGASSEVKANLNSQLSSPIKTRETLDTLSKYNGSQAKVQQAKKATDEMIVNGGEVFVKRILTGDTVAEDGKTRVATFNDQQTLQMLEKHKEAFVKHYAFSAQHNPQIVDNFYTIFSDKIRDQATEIMAQGVKDVENAQARAYEIGQYQKKRDLDNQQREAFAEAMNFTTKIMATENQPVCPTKQDIINMTKQYAYASAVANLEEAENYFEKYGEFSRTSVEQSPISSDGENAFIFGDGIIRNMTTQMIAQSQVKNNNIKDLLKNRNAILEKTDFFESLSHQFNPTSLNTDFTIVPFSAKLNEPILNFEKEVESYIRQAILSKVESKEAKEELSKLELDEIIKNKKVSSLTDEEEFKTLVSLHNANKEIENGINKQVEKFLTELPKKTAMVIKDKQFDKKSLDAYKKNVKEILKSNNLEATANEETFITYLVALSNDEGINEKASENIYKIATALANGDIRSYVKFTLMSDLYMQEVKNLDELPTESTDDDFSAREYAESAKHNIQDAYAKQNEFIQKVLNPTLENFVPEIQTKIRKDIQNGEIQTASELQQKLIDHCKETKRLDGRNLGEDAISKMIESAKFSPNDPRLEEKLSSIMNVINKKAKSLNDKTFTIDNETQLFNDIVTKIKNQIKEDKTAIADIAPLFKKEFSKIDLDKIITETLTKQSGLDFITDAKSHIDKQNDLNKQIAIQRETSHYLLSAVDKVLADEFLIASTILDEKDIKKLIKGSEVAGLQDTTRNLKALENVIPKENAKANFRAGRGTLKKSSTEQKVTKKEDKAITAYTKNSAVKEMTSMISDVQKEFATLDFQAGDDGVLRDKLFELTKSEKFQACLKALDIDPKTFASTSKDFSLENFNASIGKIANEKSVKSSKSEKAFKKVVSKFAKNVTDKGKTNTTFTFRIKSKANKQKEEEEKKKQQENEKKKELERKKEQGLLNEDEKKALNALNQKPEKPAEHEADSESENENDK